MKSVLLVVLAVVLLSLLSSPAHAQTLQFTDYTSGFTAQVPSIPVSAAADTSYDTSAFSSFHFGLSLLPDTGSANVFSFNVPPSVNVTSTNPAACTPAFIGFSLNASNAQCNYTAAWRGPFVGVLTVTMDSTASGGLARALSLSIFFTAPASASSSAPSVTSTRAAASSTAAGPAAVSSSSAARVAPATSTPSPIPSSTASTPAATSAPAAASPTSAGAPQVALGPVMFTDFSGGFSVEIPSTSSAVLASLNPNTYTSAQPGAFRFGVHLLPTAASSRFSLNYPGASVSVVSTSSCPIVQGAYELDVGGQTLCNFTATWVTAFTGLLTLTVDSAVNTGAEQALSISTLFTAANATAGIDPEGSLCLLSYASPGSVDNPSSTAIQLSVNYFATLVTTPAGLTAVQLLGATGTRTYTNRFGASFTTTLTLSAAGANNNLLFLNGAIPVDSAGMAFALGSAIQLPGNGPVQLFSTLSLVDEGGVVVEVGATSQVDASSQAYLSNIPNFVNRTIGAADVNALAADYANCQAPITFTNGLRSPTQPSIENGASQFSFSYYLSDGATYSVQANLTISTSSAFANTKDQLGNPYQTVTAVSGTRLYTSLSDGSMLRSTITGLSSGAAAVNASQRFYPYSLLAAPPGLYTVNNAPFLDGAGIAFMVSPAIPALGDSAQSFTVYPTATVRLLSSQSADAVVVDGVVLSSPLESLQLQSYSLH